MAVWPRASASAASAFKGSAAAAGQHDGPAVVQQAERRGAADAAAGAGDQRDLLGVIAFKGVSWGDGRLDRRRGRGHGHGEAADVRHAPADDIARLQAGPRPRACRCRPGRRAPSATERDNIATRSATGHKRPARSARWRSMPLTASHTAPCRGWPQIGRRHHRRAGRRVVEGLGGLPGAAGALGLLLQVAPREVQACGIAPDVMRLDLRPGRCRSPPRPMATTSSISWQKSPVAGG